MSNLSEEEILDKLRKMLYYIQKANECGLSNNDFKEHIEALEGILDLYNKEKEKNKELTEYLIIQNYEINRLNLDKIKLEISQLPDTSESYKYLKHEYEMRLGRMNLEDYKRNYISKDKIKDLIICRKFELQQEYKDFEDDIKLKTLQQLLEEE